MKAVICPICKGVKSDKGCFGCSGKGWVAVPGDIQGIQGIPPIVQGILLAQFLRAIGFRGFWR